MSILRHLAIPPLAFAIRHYDIRVILGVTILSRIFLLAIYLASGGPGLSEFDLANTIALP
jgi:hypothetical protein